ncbi:hypothetical protein DPMN_113239 [Dreissena polymorpha]|uniref:Uncharacterized protein n=1 Tax=Dreissena polymorpha TaxID=45954 RepID=A0A9D4KIF5_DREPO|nr:hypothetical protein DPMN_113239 [Dreissena polymorpha]
MDTIPALDLTSKCGRQIRNAPLGFIGDLSKSLFGPATQEDVQKIADKVNRMIAAGRGLQSDLIAHERHFESYMSLSSRKMANMERFINRTVEGMTSIQRNIHSFENMTELRIHALEQSKDSIFKMLLVAEEINQYLSDLQVGLDHVAAGIMPYQLIKPADISSVMDRLEDTLKKAGSPLRILQRDPAFYYRSATFLANIVGGRDIWVTLKVPVGMRTDMDLYRVLVFGVPFENHTVLIKDLPAYFMVDASTASRTEEVVFQAIDAEDIAQCTGKHHRVCDLVLNAQPASDSTACVAAVWMDDQQKVETNCNTVILPESRRPIARPMANGRVLFVDVKDFNKTCNGKPTTIESGCTFCMVTLPCNCMISTPFATNIVAPSRRTCQNEKDSTDITKIHLTNLHLLKTRLDYTLKIQIHFPSSVYKQDVITSAEYSFDNITREYLKSQSRVEVELSTLQERAHQLLAKTEKDRDVSDYFEFRGNLHTGLGSVGLFGLLCLIVWQAWTTRRMLAIQKSVRYALAVARSKRVDAKYGDVLFDADDEAV